MSEKNVEIVQRLYAGVTARLEVPQELFDPDFELDQKAQRSTVVGLRNDGVISNEVMSQIERELDLEDSRLEI
ncbi:MAG: hypothetical protein ACXWZM_08400 [Solirubrobacterales bacterium]